LCSGVDGNSTTDNIVLDERNSVVILVSDDILWEAFVF